MNERIKEKIEEIEGLLSQLSESVPEHLEDCKNNWKTKALCERIVEKIIEAIVDCAFLTIRRKNLPMPEDEESSFYVLSKATVISLALAKSLKDAKGMRNIIAHEYGSIDDEIVFQAAKDELPRDVREFLGAIRNALAQEEEKNDALR